MVQWWMVKWCNGDIKYGKNIRTHQNNSSSTDKGTICENNLCYSLWRSCGHLYVPLVLYLPFLMGVRFSKLSLKLLLLWQILLYFALYPLLLLYPFDLITLFSLWLLPQIYCLHHSELKNHPLKEELIMGNGEIVSKNQTIYLNKNTIDKWWYSEIPIKNLILNNMNILTCFYPTLPRFDFISGHFKNWSLPLPILHVL